MSLNSDKSGDSTISLATIVANVATERIWLDTTGLRIRLRAIFMLGELRKYKFLID